MLPLSLELFPLKMGHELMTLSQFPCPFCSCFSIASVSAFSFCYSQCLLPHWQHYPPPTSSLHLRAPLPLFQWGRTAETLSLAALIQDSTLTSFLSTVGLLCPPWALHPLTTMFLPEISIVLRLHRQLFVQPASQPSMDLQGLGLEVQLQLMVNGKSGTSFILVRVCSRADWAGKVLMLQVKFHSLV